MIAYYNEFAPDAAAWLRNLAAAGVITDGRVDARDIREVVADDVAGFDRVHCFAGIGGWEEALRLATWPAAVPVWTGSCPCQPFSVAGRRGGERDARHVWPEFLRLIAECRPAIVFGEQVASTDARTWLAGVRADLEALGYAVGAADLCAAGVGAPHIRQRLYWVAYTGRRCVQLLRQYRDASCAAPAIAGATRQRKRGGSNARSGCAVDRLADTQGPRRRRRQQRRAHPPQTDSRTRLLRPGRYGSATPWDGQFEHCGDGKYRRVPDPASGVLPLAHGIPRGVVRLCPELRGVETRARSSRVTQLRGFGNAIVPQVAAEFIRAFVEAVTQ